MKKIRVDDIREMSIERNVIMELKWYSRRFTLVVFEPDW